MCFLRVPIVIALVRALKQKEKQQLFIKGRIFSRLCNLLGHLSVPLPRAHLSNQCPQVAVRCRHHSFHTALNSRSVFLPIALTKSCTSDLLKPWPLFHINSPPQRHNLQDFRSPSLSFGSNYS